MHLTKSLYIFKRNTFLFFGLNIFFIPIDTLIFRFSPSKFFLQILVPKKVSIFTFDPSFKVNSYVEFIFLNKILQKNS